MKWGNYDFHERLNILYPGLCPNIYRVLHKVRYNYDLIYDDTYKMFYCIREILQSISGCMLILVMRVKTKIVFMLLA